MNTKANSLKHTNQIILSIISALAILCSCGKGTPISETEHFSFYAHGDVTVNEEFAQSAESAYNEFSHHWKSMPAKTNVIIHSDLKSLHNEIKKRAKVSSVPEWVTATSLDDELHTILPSQYAKNPQNIYLQLKMGLSELCIRSISKKAPYYLENSIPRYEIDLYNSVDDYVREDLKNNTFPTLEDVLVMDGSTDITSLSFFTFAEYILNNFGYAKTEELLNGGDIEKVLGTSKAEIEKSWKDYVIKTYTTDSFKSELDNGNFVIRFNDGNKAAAMSVKNVLDENYARITDIFNFKPSEKAEFVIYDNADIFNKTRMHDTYISIDSHAATGYYLPGTSTMKLLLTNGNSAQDELDELVLHEFMHYIVMQMNENIPLFLNEGTAYYMDGISEYAQFLMTVLPMLREDKFPSLEELKDMHYDDLDLLYCSCAAVMYMVEGYGYDKLCEYIKTEDTKTAFGVDEAQLNRDMIEFLKKKYL